MLLPKAADVFPLRDSLYGRMSIFKHKNHSQSERCAHGGGHTGQAALVSLTLGHASVWWGG